MTAPPAKDQPLCVVSALDLFGLGGERLPEFIKDCNLRFVFKARSADRLSLLREKK